MDGVLRLYHSSVVAIERYGKNRSRIRIYEYLGDLIGHGEYKYDKLSRRHQSVTEYIIILYALSLGVWPT